MPTFNEPGTVYAPSQHEHPVYEWTQADLDDFRTGWATLTEERKQFSRDQPALYANTPEGVLNIRTAEIVEAPAPKPEPEAEPDEDETKARTAARTKKSRTP